MNPTVIARQMVVGGLVALLTLVAAPAAQASSTSPTITLGSHTAGQATSVTAQWTTTPTFTYLTGYIQRLQLNGFSATETFSTPACSWITYSDAKTAAGCHLFTAGGNVYLDWTSQYNGTSQGVPVTVTVTIPTGYVTNPPTAGSYSAFSGDETASGPTITMSAATTVAIYSADSALSNLTCAMCTLSPTFSSGTVDYSSVVGEEITSVTVTPTVSDAGASVTVNGASVVSGTASAPIAVSSGRTTITVVVTADDLTTTTYVVALSRVDDESPPPTWHQAYGRADVSEECRIGWTPSWAEWMHNRAGGFTCERRVEWNQVTGSWVTRAGFFGL